MVPWFERPVIYDVRARPHLVESTSGSRDLQMVDVLCLSYFLKILLYIFDGTLLDNTSFVDALKEVAENSESFDFSFLSLCIIFKSL